MVIVALLLALLGYCALQITGSVIVVDRSGDVERARARTYDQEQPLLRLPGGVFFVFPDLSGDGWVEIHCRGGVRRTAGYVSGIGMVRIDVTEGCTVDEIF